MTNWAGIRKRWIPVQKALSIDPGYVKAWNNKGLALDKLGRYQEAVDSYEKALSIDPNDATVWHNKGLALDKLGRYQEAADSYERALINRPERRNGME